MFLPPYGVQGFEFHSFLFVESNFLKNKTFSSHCWSIIRPVGISKGGRLVCIRPNHRLAAGMWHIISTGCPNQLLNSSARPGLMVHTMQPRGRRAVGFTKRPIITRRICHSRRTQSLWKRGGVCGQGGRLHLSDFSHSVDPISIRGGRLCPPHYYVPPRIVTPSYVPEVSYQTIDVNLSR